MADVFSNVVRCVSIALAIVLLAGCERASAVSDSRQPVQNPVERQIASTVDSQPAKLTLEMQKAELMREALDVGDTRKALVIARGLVDAKEQKVLLRVVEAMEWVGKAAFPELTELADNKDEIVAEAALQAWDRVIDGVEDKNMRLSVIMKTARSLSRENLIDAVFLKLVDCDQIAALSALAEFVETNKGAVANRCAKEIYAHLASEPWESAVRTAELIQELKEKENKS